MGWFKVDDQLAFHSKTVMAGNEAMGLWVRAGSWASAQLTGGFIAKHMANAMAKECDAIALVEAGLWSEVDGGFQFHDWNEFQPDAEEERKKREETRRARSEAGKKGAQARWSDSKKDDLPSVSHSKPMANEWQPDSKTMPPTRPDPIPKGIEGTPTKKRGSRINEAWMPKPETVTALGKEFPHIDQKMEHRKFVDHWLAESGAKASKLDWEATYRNWIRRSAEYNPAPQQTGPSPWDVKGIH